MISKEAYTQKSQQEEGDLGSSCRENLYIEELRPGF